MNDLFRTEAIDHQRQKLVGSIILRQAWPVQLLMSIFIAIFIALIFIFFFFGFARHETLLGTLKPSGGLINVSSPTSGIIEKILFTEEQEVRSGDLLFIISTERISGHGPTHQRMGAAFRNQRERLSEQIELAKRQNDQRRNALRKRDARLDSKLQQLDVSLTLQRERAGLASTAAQRFASTEYSTVVSREKLDEKRADAIEQEIRVTALQRERSELLVERETLIAEMQALPLQLQYEVSKIENSINDLNRAEAENDIQQRWEIRAPRSGKLTLVIAEIGETVTSGAVLASVAPENTALEAVLYAPSRAAGQIKTGTNVQIRFSSLPYQKYGQFSGKVREISSSPVPELEQASLNSPRVAMYRVRVSLEGDRLTPELRTALKVGMQVEAIVMLEYRRFYEWVLEPVLGLRTLTG